MTVVKPKPNSPKGAGLPNLFSMPGYSLRLRVSLEKKIARDKNLTISFSLALTRISPSPFSPAGRTLPQRIWI